MQVEVAVLGSPSLVSLMISVDVKQHEKEKKRSLDYQQRVMRNI